MVESDKTFYILLVVGVLFIFGLVVTNVRINKMNKKTSKLQKHVLYQQSIIEKHHKLIAKNETEEKLIPAPAIIAEEELPEPISIVPTTTPPPPPPVETSARSNRGSSSPLTNLLPLMSSMMTMMNVVETPANVVNIDNHTPMSTNSPSIEEIENGQVDQKQMLSDIQSELEELKITSEKREMADLDAKNNEIVIEELPIENTLNTLNTLKPLETTNVLPVQ